MILGVDIGGSKVALVLVDGGAVVARDHAIYDAGVLTSFDTWRGWIEQLVQSFLQKQQVIPHAVGIASAGVIHEGVIEVSPHLPFLNGKNIKQEVERAFGLPSVIENDANAFLWAEHKKGAARDMQHAVGLTIGTGVGGGVLIDGRLYRGARGGAGEVGFMVIDNNTFERCAGGAYFKQFEKSPKDIEDAARNGDAEAQNVYHEFGKSLGVGIGNLINILDPEGVVIGGGIAHAFDIFSDSMHEAIQDAVLSPRAHKETSVVPAQLNRYAPAIGAALLTKEER